MNFPPELFFRRFKPTPGAISCTEACAINWLASQAPKGHYAIDCGSHAGKAAMSAANSLPMGILIMVDPIYDLTNEEAWSHSIQGHPSNNPWPYVNAEDFNSKVEENIKIVSAMNVKAALKGDYSENVIPQYAQYSWAFIDSNTHDDGMAIRESKLLEDRVVKGGIIAYHDWNSQFADPKIASDYLVSTGKYEYVEIPWGEIIAYVKENNIEKDNQSWHHTEMNFPNFVGAVKRIK